MAREWPADTFAVHLRLDEQAASRLATLTRRLYETNDTDSPDRLAILLDSETLFAAVVDEVILDGAVRVSGDFEFEQAQDLAVLLTDGPLPVPLRLVGTERAQLEVLR